MLQNLTIFPLVIDVALTAFGAAVWLSWLVVFTAAPLTRLWVWLVRRIRAALAERRSA